jgi:hypothetical protein
MQPDFTDPESMPLRFMAPDGWRNPDPQWVCLYQGFEPGPDWQPYPDCPPAPPNWPFWEENGSSWFSFFQYLSPPPSRILGWWFALAAAGLFATAVLPFAFPWPQSVVPEIIALTALVLGVVGTIRSLKRQSRWLTGDPMDQVRRWAEAYRKEFLHQAYLRHRRTGDVEITFDQFEELMSSWWWRERNEAEAN